MRKMSLTCQLRRSAAICFLGAATVLACGSTEVSKGYLPVIGPAPLRYLPLPDRANAFAQLPLPEPVKPDSVPATPSSEQTEEVNPFALSDTLAPAADRGADVMEASSPPPVPQTPPVDQQPISPRVFLQYFNAVPNLPPSANPSAPVDFTPPRSAGSGRFSPSSTP
jgi:hypothetical protein